MRQIFQHSDKKAFFLTSLVSLLSVMSITLLYYIRQQLALSEYSYTIVYTSLILISSLLYYRRQRVSGWILQSTIWIGGALLGGILGGYSLAALGEESLKWIYIKKFITGLLGEIILLGIVSGIVFGRTENLVYIIQHITKDIPNNTILSIIQQRGIIPLLVHIGSLCLALILGFQLRTKISPILARSIAGVSSIGSHFLFNISQSYQFSLGSAIIILGYLIIISYSLFRSNVLYISQEDTIKLDT